jgi:hypothetical protein
MEDKGEKSSKKTILSRMPENIISAAFQRITLHDMAAI